MKKLEFRETVCEEPLAVSVETFEKYADEGHDSVLVNGIVTHISRTAETSAWDSEKIKKAVSEIIYRINEEGEDFKKTSVSALCQLVVTVEKKGGYYLFNSVRVVPNYI